MADIFPDRIGLSDEDYQALTDAYKIAYQRIAAELQNSTNFGYSNRAHLLKQIEGIMNDYGMAVDQFITKEIPAQYAEGARLAIEQLNSLGKDIAPFETFSAIDKQAVEALVTQTQASLGAAMAGVTKNMTQLLTSAQKATVRQIITEGVIGGEARQTIKDRIISEFQDSGIGSLEDSAGKTWQLDSYADMLVRTNAAAARNEAITNTIQDVGEDLVEVSSHGATDVCGDWEGAILSISGDNADQYDGSVDDAEADGLFHPNCEHTLSAYIPDAVDMTSGDGSGDTSGDAGGEVSLE